MTVNKIDSNFTGLRYAMEVPSFPKSLPGGGSAHDGSQAVWKELEPNSYSDFGGTTTLKARTPITATRQRRKGRAVDLEAKAGFNIDFTSDNMLDLMPCFMFAAWRRAAVSEVDAITTVTAGTPGVYNKVAAFVGHAVVGSLVNASGFTNPGNNGLKRVTVVAADALSVAQAGIAEGAPPAASELKVVGFQSAAGDLGINAANPALPTITSTALDFTTLNLVPGQWMFIGGDTGLSNFSSPANFGFVRVAAVSAHVLTLDKTGLPFVTEAGVAQTVQLFFGDFLKNESDPTLIVAQTVQFERSLSTAGFEYLPGSFANELTIDLKSADKIELVLSFISLDAQEEDFADRKAGTFPDLSTDPNFYNTSTDLIRIRASEQGSATPLFAFLQTMSLKVSNNVSPLKALGVFGAFDVSIGDFVVDGDITAYFSDIAAVTAVRQADSLTLDFALALDNRGWIFDIPLLVFDKGQLNVTKDQPVTIPVGINAAADTTLNTTLQMVYFSYLPDLASA